jgi:hypothetical protein
MPSRKHASHAQVNAADSVSVFGSAMLSLQFLKGQPRTTKRHAAAGDRLARVQGGIS